MKKVLLFIMLICTMFYANIAYAENELIDGLEENMETLWLKNYFTQEQMNDMNEQQQAFKEMFYSLTWTQAQTVWKKPRGLTQDEMFEYQLNEQRVNISEGVRVYRLNTNFKYAKQYLQNEQFNYLVSDNYYYWIAPRIERQQFYEAFMSNGEYKERGTSGEKKWRYIISQWRV